MQDPERDETGAGIPVGAPRPSDESYPNTAAFTRPAGWKRWHDSQWFDEWQRLARHET